jgi:hypothetical protein
MLDGCRVRPDAGSGIRNFGDRGAIETYVSPLRFLVDVFVNTFGITPPTAENQARAGRVIALMLGGVLVVLVAVALVLRATLAR